MAYDRAEWHEDGAREAAQSSATAFSHGELYVRWLARRDLLAVASPVRGLVSPDDMTDEGRSFTDAYYGRYLDDYAAVFADRPAYAVTADDDAFDRIAPVIDQRYAEWVYAGRPALPPDDEPREQLARLLEDAEVPPELTEAAVLAMSPDQVMAALQQVIRRGRTR